jgi:hypothetical protein
MKRIVLILIVIISLVTAANVVVVEAKTGSVPPPSGMISWWPGDGNAQDIIGGNNGTLQNGATFAAGKVAQAFSLDGNDDLILVPDSPSLNPTSGITLDAWVYVTGKQGQDRDIISKDGEEYDRQYLLTASQNDKFRPHVGLQTGFYYFDGSTTVQLNRWYHVAMTYDGAYLKLYVDGALDGSLYISETMNTTSQPVRIGGGAPPSYQQCYFQGLIDEVEIFNRALSASEIQAIYDAGSAGKLKGENVVGGKAYPINKVSLIAPWIIAALVIAVGGFWLVRRRAKS